MPSIEEADVVGYFDALLVRLPLKEKFLVRGLLALLEVQSLVFGGLRPRLFTQTPITARIANLAAWEKSNIFERRLTFMAIRTLLLWAYADSQEVERGMGFVPGTHSTAKHYHPEPGGHTSRIEEAADRARGLFVQHSSLSRSESAPI
jgi:hypothetical protein